MPFVVKSARDVRKKVLSGGEKVSIPTQKVFFVTAIVDFLVIIEKGGKGRVDSRTERPFHSGMHYPNNWICINQ
jgi:hypothetical protein